MDEIQNNDTNADPTPMWITFDMKPIKEEKEESPSSVLDPCHGSSTQEINDDRQNEDWGKITIKKEPGFEIEQNYTEVAFSPERLSFEIEKIKEELVNPPSSVIDLWDGSYQEFEHEDVDKGFNQEILKKVPNSTFSNMFDENTDDVYGNRLNTKRSLRTQKSELTDEKENKCNFCDECFIESSQLERHVYILHNPLTSNFEMEFLEWGKTTVKKEPVIEIEHCTEVASITNWLSLEVKTIKEENSLRESENKGADEVYYSVISFSENNQENYENVVDSTFSNVCEKNVGVRNKGNNDDDYLLMEYTGIDNITLYLDYKNYEKDGHVNGTHMT
ncbi:hypothetical protein GQR58_003955 [Nymphon striatum]|nr:hypothetical protein GQR58_003955 [Nymphon striatum]